MVRTAEDTAKILIGLFNRQFDQDYGAPFRIGWPQLRSLVGVSRLTDTLLKDINSALSEFGQTLIPLNNSLLVAGEDDFDHYRMIPDKIVEELIPDGTADPFDDDEQELNTYDFQASSPQ